MTILDTIVSYKKTEVEAYKKDYQYILNDDLTFKNPMSLVDKIKKNKHIDVIAEIKKGSPSKGIFTNDFKIDTLVDYYTSQCASCISVLTDKKFFYGGFHVLKQVRGSTDLPLLCKDFIIDEFQIKMAKHFGANVVLLIKRILDKDHFKNLLDCAHHHQLEVLVEVDSLEEFDSIKDMDFKLCGVNNRDLSDFEVNINKTVDLAPHIIKAGKLLISESGIYSPDQVKTLRQSGISAVLVGESLIRDENKGLLKSLQVLKKSTRIKICGLQSKETVIAVDDLHVDYIGFVFAKSKRQVSIEQVKSIRPYISHAKVVGVFMDQSNDFINQCFENCQLDYVQIHGKFDYNGLNIPIEKIIKAQAYDSTILEDYNYILIDNHNPGSGQSYQIESVKIYDHQELILAGGLNIENVEKKIHTLYPHTVDVSSGVENNGRKDMDMIKTFIEKVRGL